MLANDPTAFMWHVLVCQKCYREIRFLQSPLCLQCGIPFKTKMSQDHLCGACLKDPGPFKMARAVAVYEGPVRQLIHLVKFKQRPNLARRLGQLLWSVYQHYWKFVPVDLILPVPLHPRKMRERGYNQSQLLIAGWPRIAETPLNIKNILKRRRYTVSQTGLTSRERRQNVRKAFEIVQTAKMPKLIEGRRILLVDDVYTTGWTVRACAETLLAAGAKRVDVLTLARVV